MYNTGPVLSDSYLEHVHACTQIFKPGGGTEDVDKMQELIEKSKLERKEKLRTVNYNAKYDKYKELK